MLSALLFTATCPPAPTSAAFIPLEERALTVDASSIRFVPSRKSDVAPVQAALVQAWGALQAEFVEEHAVSGPAWEAALRSALAATAAAPDAETAWGVVEGLASSLGDQYTRVLRPGGGGGEGAASYAADLAGRGRSLGVQLRRGAATDAVTVAAVVPGSPAASVGIAVGEEILSINGAPVRGHAPADLARALTDEADLEFPLHAVQHAVLPGRVVGGGPVAYLRVAAFNDLTSCDVASALASVTRTSPSALILDLRDNAGGSVAAAVDVAGQLLEGVGGEKRGPPLLLARVQDGRGGEEAVPVPPPSVRPAWPSATRPPTAVLINGATASSSELLAGALAQPPSSTLLVGEQSFGKGRTQRSIPLTGGGLLVVSNRLFVTPTGAAVDGGLGLKPGVVCVPDSTEAGFFVSGGDGEDNSGSSALTEGLLSDPCVRLAAARLGVELQEAGM